MNNVVEGRAYGEGEGNVTGRDKVNEEGAVAKATGGSLDDGPWQQMSDAATPGPWAKDAWSNRVIVAPPVDPPPGWRATSIVDARYKNGAADAALIVAAVNYVRSLLPASAEAASTSTSSTSGDRP